MSPADDDLSARLAALRGMPSVPTASVRTTLVKHVRPLGDPAPEPTREDTLADRLRALRSQAEASDPIAPPRGAAATSPRAPEEAIKDAATHAKDRENKRGVEDDKDEDAYLQTDDETLEELLQDLNDGPPDWLEDVLDPGDQQEQTKNAASDTKDAEFEKLSKELQALADAKPEDGDEDREEATIDREADAVLTSTLSTMHLDSSLPSAPSDAPISLHLPSAPSNLPPPAPTNPLSSLPSVPGTNPHKRLVATSRAGYTDSDVRTWCIVCLEDATLKCLDCDEGDDVYCQRCWNEMHLGPMAGAEEGGHRAVRFVRDAKKETRKVLLGA